jgi:hypothetical protein
MSHPKYRAARHSSKLNDVEQIFSIAEKLVRRLPPPWQRKMQRGKPLGKQREQCVNNHGFLLDLECSKARASLLST